MIHVEFDPSTLTTEQEAWWKKWLQKAEKATEDAIGHHPINHEFQTEVWGELKKFLLEHVFHGKCAYCESELDPVAPGDAEHYRPKGGVTLKDQNGTRPVRLSDGLAHPGYVWLAYHWRNLIPSCTFCNSGDGKMNQFPVKGKHFYDYDRSKWLDPDRLDAEEEPLLLHPYDKTRNPRRYLCFSEKGIIAARNGEEAGKRTIEVCHLKREKLRKARQKSQENADVHFLAAVLAQRKGAPDAVRDFLAPYQRGEVEHSAAVLDFLLSVLPDVQKAVEDAASVR